MALKEQIEMTKKARDVKLLHEELKNSELMKQQIDDALAQTPKNTAMTTGNELKSGNWFVEKTLEQRVTIQNKCDFLQNEATTAQEKLLRRVGVMLKLRIRRPHVGEKSCLKKKIKEKLIYRKEILFVTFNGIIFATKAP